MVFIDAQPSETLGARADENVSVVGVVSSLDHGLDGLSQYKRPRAHRRPEMALLLSNAIEQDEVELNAVACHSSFRQVDRFGSEVLATVPDKVVSRNAEIGDYDFRHHSLPRDIAVFAAWYAAAIVFIGQRVAFWANKIDTSKVTLICDHFPTSSERVMKSIMTATLLCPGLKRCWDKSKEKYGVSFSVTNLSSVQTPQDSEPKPGKEHAEMIFADWLVHSHYAEINPTDYYDTDTKRDEEYRIAITRPWQSLQAKRRALSIELGPELSPDPERFGRQEFESEKYD